jgi:hypothetical protein
MRTAICFSGQPREVADIWPTFVNNLLNQMPSPDVFIHSSGPYPDAFLKAVQPKKYVVEPQVCYPHLENLLKMVGYLPDDNRNSCLQEFNGVKQANLLKRAYEQEHGFHYDLVVKTRPDLLYLRPITLDLLELDKINNLIVPDFPFYISEFAIGPNDQMDRYCELFDWFSQHGERFLNRDNPRFKYRNQFSPLIILAIYLEDYCGFTLGRPNLPEDVKKMHRKYTGSAYYRIMYRQKLGYYETDLKIQEQEDKRMGWSK